GGKLPAHVSCPNQRLRPAGRPEGGDGSATVARGAGPGQRSDGEDDPVVRIKGFGSRRYLVPHHLEAYPGSPQVVLITLYRIVGPDAAGREVDVEHLPGPASVLRHCPSLLLIRCCARHSSLPLTHRAPPHSRGPLPLCGKTASCPGSPCRHGSQGRRRIY